jgi:hypothetical protein
MHMVLSDFGAVDVFQAVFCLFSTKNTHEWPKPFQTQVLYATRVFPKGVLRKLGKGAMDWLF